MSSGDKMAPFLASEMAWICQMIPMSGCTFTPKGCSRPKFSSSVNIWQWQSMLIWFVSKSLWWISYLTQLFDEEDTPVANINNTVIIDNWYVDDNDDNEDDDDEVLGPEALSAATPLLFHSNYWTSKLEEILKSHFPLAIIDSTQKHNSWIQKMKITSKFLHTCL